MLHELSLAGGVGTIATAQLEFRAPAGRPCYIREIGLFLTAATASRLGLGRPANVPAGGSLVTGEPNISDDPASGGGLVASGWSTAPTAPAKFIRRIGLPAAIGNGVIWSWGDRGWRVKQGTSLVVWNITASGIVDGYFVWED